jgi:transcription elongation factor Elf1
MKKRIIRHGRVWAERRLTEEAYICPECNASNSAVSGSHEAVSTDFINLRCYNCNCIYEIKV